MSPERLRQIEELYHSAREREPGERSAFLAEACGEDDVLRREVESLLGQNGPTDALVDRSSFEAEAGTIETSTILTPGARVGPYQIVGPLGAGGMGKVYRAVDTRLKRTVAVKVAKENFGERFERESRAIAALNHPNICTLYDVGPNYLVMELIEGPTLAERIKQGPVPLEEALGIARQIADALEAAHEKSVVHRDLKPGNIKIKPNGIVKVLDFGLAKVAPDVADDSPAEATATLTTRGMILGTAAYMSPEQAQGKPVDKRADIWAFGVLLYEMLTGRRMFQGETVSDTLAAVLTKEPEWERVPAKVQRLLKRCLEKDPQKRLRDISAVGLLLEETPQGMAPRHTRVPWAVAAFVAAVAVVGWWYATRPAPLRPLIHVDAEIAADTPLASGPSRGGMLALSPDGSRLALTLRGAGGKALLYTRLLDQNQVTPLVETENAYFPFFSPDGEWIGFFADGKLKKISVKGGAAVTLCDAPGVGGASWGDDGNIIVALGNSGLWRIPSSGGTPVPLTKVNRGEGTHRWPQVLPDSQAVLFTASTGVGPFEDADIDVISLKTGERKTVQRGGFSPRYLATSNRTGYLVYLHQRTLFAVPFDPGRLTLAGAPKPILEDVGPGEAAGVFAFAGAPSGPGTFVYLAWKVTKAGGPISWLERGGKMEPLQAPPGSYAIPRFSPDGKRLAYSVFSGPGADIWVKDLDRDTPYRLSFLAGTNRWAVWTPDGKNIVFHSTNPAAPGLYWIRSDGSGKAQRLTDGKLVDIPYSFSPDGKRLAFWVPGKSGGDIFTAPIEGDPGRGALGVRLGKAELFLGTPFDERSPAFSPDGRWLAYASNESGSFEVCVRPFPGPGGQWQISTGGGQYPLWSRDGRELVYETLDGRVMVVSYSAKGDSFTFDKPRVWSETRVLNMGAAPMYDLAPDGKRLAARLADDGATHLTFLLNFSDELRRRVPAGK